MAADWSRSETISDPDEIVINYTTKNAQGQSEKKEVVLISTPRSVNTTYHGPITYTDAEGKTQTREIITRKTDEKRTTVAAVNPAYISWRLSQGLGLPSGDVWNLTETTYEYSITTDGPKVVREQVSDFITEWQLAGSLAIKKYNNYEPTADQFESNRTVTLNDEWTGTDGRTISRRRVSRWIALGLISEGSQSVQRQIDSIKFFLSKTQDLNGTNQKAIVDKAKKLIFEGTEVQIETGKLPVPEMPSGADRIADEIVNGSDTTDLDGDGIPDWAKYDANDPFDVDINGDGISDWVDLNSLYEPDERRTNNDFTFDDQLSYQASSYDSATGLPIDPISGLPVKAISDFEINPTTGQLINPSTGQPYNPPITVAVDPATGEPLDPGLGLLINPSTGQPYNPPRFTRVDPDNGSPIFAGDSVTADYSMPFAPDDTIEFVDGVRTLVPGGSEEAARRFGQIEAWMDHGHAYGFNITTGFNEVPSLPLAPLYVQMAGVEGAFLMDSVSYAWGPEGMVVSSDLMLLGATGRYGTTVPSASWLRVPVAVSELQQINTTGTVEASPQKANTIAIPNGFDARNPAATLAALPTNGTDVFREWRDGNQLVEPVVRIRRQKLFTKPILKVKEFTYSLTPVVESPVLMTGPVLMASEVRVVELPSADVIVAGLTPSITGGGAIVAPVATVQLATLPPAVLTGAAVQMPAAAVQVAGAGPTVEASGVVLVKPPVVAIAIEALTPSVSTGAAVLPPSFDIAVAVLAPTVSTSATDPYFSSVSLLLHMDGSNGSTTFTDSSVNALAVTANGNAQISTAQSKFGGASGYFDGSSDYLSIADSSTLELNSADFTIELWLYVISGRDRGIAGKGTWPNSGVSSWLIYYGGLGELAFYASSTGLSWNVASNAVLSSSLGTAQWHHVAISRSSGTIRGYFNGVQTFAITSSAVLQDNGSALTIGAGSNGINSLNGHIDEFRITKGVARYTANFTPPTAPFPNA